ncbi:hypothetical protein F2Q68_00002849 [Brassica cretica]|uniref:AP2/ERF domain-containing protein n=1 Tax=Brassica cretica TaxID=69181 RepID=A0A8S9J7Z6_BRACR|nr:hypothetical protein F2Q68_00002849 [Brassica cretica]
MLKKDRINLEVKFMRKACMKEPNRGSRLGLGTFPTAEEAAKVMFDPLARLTFPVSEFTSTLSQSEVCTVDDKGVLGGDVCVEARGC